VAKTTILLVEDNPDDEALLMRALRKSMISTDVIVARNGAEALDYLFSTGPYTGRDTSATSTLVLLDLNLPKIGGLEVLRRLRVDSRTKLIPVVVLSSSDEDRDLIASYSLGVNSYVRKPVDFTRFVDVVQQIGRYWLTLNEPPPLRAGRDGQSAASPHH
jgi:two-component system, response regulator